jgi:hypothetical protein
MKYVRAADEIFTTRSERFRTAHGIIESALKYSQHGGV